MGNSDDYGFDDIIINKERVIVAVNCGGHGFTDGNGIVFSEDQYFGYNDGTKFGGGGGYYHVMNGKKDKSPMYMSCRSKHDNFWYSIPVPNGDVCLPGVRRNFRIFQHKAFIRCSNK